MQILKTGAFRQLFYKKLHFDQNVIKITQKNGKAMAILQNVGKVSIVGVIEVMPHFGEVLLKATLNWGANLWCTSLSANCTI